MEIYNHAHAVGCLVFVEGMLTEHFVLSFGLSSPGLILQGHHQGMNCNPAVPAVSCQMYKLVVGNCWGNLSTCCEVASDGLASHPGDG